MVRMSQKPLPPLTSEDCEAIWIALSMRKNYIETGNVVLSAADAAEQKKPFKALTVEQMQLVIRLDRLIKLFLNRS